MASIPNSPTQSSIDNPQVAARLEERERLRTSRFDSITSFFMALIIFIGTFVGMLVIIFIMSRWTYSPPPIMPPIEEPAGRGENPEGFERDFEPPGAEEVEELMEPTLQDTLEAVTDAVSTVAGALATTDTASTATTSGTGAGDSRPPGPPGEGEDIVPRFERWQLNFTARDVRSYATQLDYFKIELGAIGGSIQGVDVASNLSTRIQKSRIEDTASEKRLYFMWNSPSPLMQFDRQLLTSAGIQLTNRQMLKFIPKELEDQLAVIELEYSTEKGHPSVTEIAKTVFESKSDGGNYVFEVVSQRYRKPR
ncbi:MAG: hypothetical protein ACON4H_14230 [Rubripirellula sp.]|jgi:hypothetical protein